MNLPAIVFGHAVTVERYEGEGAYGPVYSAAATVKCFRDDATRLVRAPDGSEVTSSATLYCPASTADIPAQSKVTYDGLTTTVVAMHRRDGGNLPTPDHLEVRLA